MREALLRVILLSLALAFPFGSLALAQSQSLGSTMDVFVFPAQAEQREVATEQQLANCKKAFSVCLEAKEYMVKY